MKKIQIALALMALLMSSPAQAAKYALLVGIDAYPRPFAPLLGCVNDATVMGKLLIEKFRFPQANVRLIANQEATFQGIAQAFRTHLIQQAQPGDIVVFYYSGHGTQTPDFNGDEDDGQDEALCPIDIGNIAPATWLTDDVLRSWLTQLRTDRVTVILDACHSGTGARGIGDLTAKSIDLGFGEGTPGTFNMRAPGAKDMAVDRAAYTVIAGSKPEQKSYISKHWQGSVMTAYIYNILSKAPSDLSYKDLMLQLTPQVQQYVTSVYPNQTQTPQFEGDPEQSVFWGVTEPPPAPQQVTPPTPTPQPVGTNEAVQQRDFELTIATNRPTYYENDLVTVTVQSSQDAYLRLYHVSVDKQTQLIFPNPWQQDNFIQAGVPVRIPGPGAPFQFRMTPPFGIEIVKAIASTVQFDDLQGVNWDNQSFVGFGAMPLARMNNQGLSSNTPARLSQAVVMYEIKPR